MGRSWVYICDPRKGWVSVPQSSFSSGPEGHGDARCFLASALHGCLSGPTRIVRASSLGNRLALACVLLPEIEEKSPSLKAVLEYWAFYTMTSPGFRQC